MPESKFVGVCIGISILLLAAGIAFWLAAPLGWRNCLRQQLSNKTFLAAVGVIG